MYYMSSLSIPFMVTAKFRSLTRAQPSNFNNVTEDEVAGEMNLFCNVLITPLVQLGSGFQGFGFRVRLKVLSSETQRPRRHVDFTI